MLDSLQERWSEIPLSGIVGDGLADHKETSIGSGE